MQNYVKPTLLVIAFDEFDVITTSGEPVLSTDPAKGDLEVWDMTVLGGGA